MDIEKLTQRGKAIVAEAMWQEIERMEVIKNTLKVDDAIFVTVNGKETFRFPSIDKVAEFALRLKDNDNG